MAEATASTTLRLPATAGRPDGSIPGILYSKVGKVTRSDRLDYLRIARDTPEAVSFPQPVSREWRSKRCKTKVTI